MLLLVVGLKVGLIVGVLMGAGLVLGRFSLQPPHAFADDNFHLMQRATLCLAAICALAAAALLVFRLGGSLDLSIAGIVLQSPTGLAAGMLLLGAIMAMSRSKLAVFGALLIIVATGIAGHASVKSFLSGMLVATHVGVASWWTGGLLILAATIRDQDSGLQKDILKRFSHQARWAILTLLAAGSWAVYDLTGFSVSVLGTVYGQILLLKQIFVTGLMGLALYNRLILTPAIGANRPGACDRLRKTIIAELSVIGVITICTAFLTTIASPPT